MSGKITKEDFKILGNFWLIPTKKHALLVLVMLVDVSLSVVVSYFYILGDETMSMELRSCLGNQTSSGITLLSQKCVGESVDRNTISVAFIYYLTFLTSIIGLVLVDVKNNTLQITQYNEVKLVYCLRAVSLFTYMDYTSEKLNEEIFYYTSWISLQSQLIMLGSSIAVSILIFVVLGSLGSFGNQGYSYMLSSLWLILTITTNVTWYIPTANIHSRNIFSFIDIRGPGLQFITYVNFSIVVLSLMEFVIINEIRREAEKLLHPNIDNSEIGEPLLIMKHGSHNQ